MNYSKKLSILGILLIFINLIIQSIDALRILGIFHMQSHSHFIMCQELMKGLAKKGHHVDVYSLFPLKSPIDNYNDFSIRESGIDYLSNNVSYESVNRMSKSTEYFIKYFFKHYQENYCNLLGHPTFKKLLNEPKNPPYDIIITELMIVHCFIPFGRHFNAPVVGVVTEPLLDWHYNGFGTPINLAVDRSSNFRTTLPMKFLDRLYNLISYYSMLQTHSKCTQKQNEYVDKYFEPGLPNTLDLLKDVSLVLVNHDVSLNAVMPFAPKIIPVGGLHIVDGNEKLAKIVEEWLDESTDGCIYFSFGSMIRIETFPKYIIDALYKSFRNIAPVRVLFKAAKPEELPLGIPSNVLVQSWFQQNAVLKHENVKLFVTHGGLMGTQESVYYGVPMVVIPLFSDQFNNAFDYAQRNIAIKLDLSDVTEDSFTYAMKEVLNNPLYKESIQRVSKQFIDRPMSPLNTAIYWIEYIHRHGKNILKSPIEDMPWWQASLLDVYAFIGGSIFIILYICKKIVQQVIYNCRSMVKLNLHRYKKVDGPF